MLDSLTQFDALWCVIAVADSGRDNNQYPSFASFYSHRSEPALEVLITDQAVREELLEERAGDLKDAVARVVSVARQLSFQQRYVPLGPFISRNLEVPGRLGRALSAWPWPGVVSVSHAVLRCPRLRPTAGARHPTASRSSCRRGRTCSTRAARSAAARLTRRRAPLPSVPAWFRTC